jgi:hypothetical protein
MEQANGQKEASEVQSKEASFVIYCHTHTESGRRYIGQTSQTMEARWKKHVYAAKFSKDGRWHFPNAIRKYGPAAFSHEILQTCNSVEEANKAEQYWIDLYNTTNLIRGFNIKKGGLHTPHPIKNPWDRPEHRARCLPISLINVKKATLASSLQKTQSKPENRARLSRIMTEIAKTPDGLAQRIAASHPGKKLSPEHRAKISANDATRRPDVRAKLSTKSKAAWENNPEYRERIIQATTGRTESPETRAKIAAAGMGRIWSEESRKKLADSVRRTYCKRGHSMDDAILSMENGHQRRHCRACYKLSKSRVRAEP